MCSIGGCDRAVYAKGWCRSHYMRDRRYGDPEAGQIERQPRLSSCSVQGCDARQVSRGWCSKHYTRWQRHGDPTTTTRGGFYRPGDPDKWCPRCQRRRPIVEFGTRPSGAPKGYCEKCQSAYDTEYAKTLEGQARRHAASHKWNKESRLEYDLRKRYGIGLEEYEALIEAQENRCAICKVAAPTLAEQADRRWNVDHCHTDGHVRGLLCNRCNLGIGKFADNPDLLRAAANYVEQNRAVL